MKFNKFIDTERIPDSMCLDSGNHICHYENNGHTIDIEVHGIVDVEYEGESYKHFTDMPKKLQEMFKDGTAWNNEDVKIIDNNWYEIFFDFNVTSDYVEIEGMKTSELEKYCKESLERYLSKIEISKSNTIEMKVDGGYFKVCKTQDPNYPGISVEFVSDDDYGQNLSRPAILFEKPVDGKLRVLIWDNPESEDYSEEIIFGNSYIKDIGSSEPHAVNHVAEQNCLI